MYGASVTEKYGFRYCCDSVAIISLVYSISYYLIADGKKAFRNSKWIEYEPDMNHMICHLGEAVSHAHGYDTPSDEMKNLS
jgi:hypothetical protein